jgi:hypothetical protein
VRLFRESTIRRKLMGILMLTSSAALVVACGAFGIHDALTSRHAMERELATLAEIVGQNGASALASGDRTAAAQALSALRAKADITAAGAYSKEGEILAGYYRTNASIPLPPQAFRGEEGISRFHNLALFHPIVRNGAAVGTIYVESDLK